MSEGRQTQFESSELRLVAVVRARLRANGDWNINDWKDAARALADQVERVTAERNRIMSPDMSEGFEQTLAEFEVIQETISRRIFTVPASSHSDAVRRWLLGEGEISRKETDDWKLYAVEVESSPFDGVPGTSSAAGGSWGNG